jgi:diguanylate cyclase (GGDEF)-like protein/PAS domain S-box-containing protein
MKRWAFACVVWLLCCAVAPRMAATPDQSPPPARPDRIRVVTDFNYPPFLFVTADGKPQGYEVDVWRLFQAHTGIKVDLEPMQWSMAQQQLLAGQADVIDMIYRTPARAGLYDFSPIYARHEAAIYVDRRIRGVHDASALRGLAVGVERGDACADKLRSQGITDLREYPDYKAVIDAAMHGNVRIFCMDEDPANYYLYRYSAIGRFNPAFVLYEGDLRRAVRKGNQAMLQVVESGMARITPAEREQLRERWLTYPVVLQPYLQAAWVALGVVIVFLALLALWVLLLRRSVSGRTRELLEEQGKLRGLFDASPDAMWVKDREGVYREANEPAKRLVPPGRGEMVGQTDEQLFGPAFATRVRARDAEVMSSGRPLTYTIPMEGSDNPVRHLEVVKVPLFARDGTVSGVLCAARDVTARLQADAELRLWAHAFQRAAVGVAIFDARTRRITAVNPRFASERGYTPEDMQGLSADALYPDDLVAQRRAARRVIDREQHALVETEHVARDGRRFPVQLDITVMHDADGHAERVIVFAQDISVRKRAEIELRLAAAAFQMQEALIVTDMHGVIERVNDAFVQLTGFSEADVLGKRPLMLVSRHHDGNHYRGMLRQLRSDGFWHGEHWIEIKHGQPKVVRTAISSVAGEHGEASHYVCAMIDLTSEREAHAGMDHLTFFDALTDLPNRNFLHSQLEHVLDPGKAEGGVLLMIDLDHFKRVNDLHGHVTGDRLLVEVAQRLCAMQDDDTLVGRFSGGTFVLLAQCRTRDALARLRSARLHAERVCEVLREPFFLGNHKPTNITASIGFTELVPGRGNPESVIKEAELALYTAKNGGRDRACGFEPAMQDDLVRREEIAHDLREAIENEALELHYQLQVDRQGRPFGAEALLRWTRPDDGESLSPGVFIPVAEETGLILPLGDWVLRRACAQLVEWSRRPAMGELSLAVNVSARQFAQTDFVDGVRAVLAETGADPARLKLEITETLILEDLAATSAKLAELRAQGIRIAVDDFGVGYSSLAYLSRLPLDQLKIDQSFVSRLPEDGNDAMVAQTVIGMGRGLGMVVVAEGVETEAQRDFLMAHGCDAFQGYLIARPLPRAAFEAMLAGT